MELIDALQRLAHFLFDTKAGVYILGFIAVYGGIVFASRQSHLVAKMLGNILLFGGVIVALSSLWGFWSHPSLEGVRWFLYAAGGLILVSGGRFILDSYTTAPPAPRRAAPSPFPNARAGTAVDIHRALSPRQQPDTQRPRRKD